MYLATTKPRTPRRPSNSRRAAGRRREKRTTTRTATTTTTTTTRATTATAGDAGCTPQLLDATPVASAGALAVNQVESHIGYHDDHLQAWCVKHGGVTEAARKIAAGELEEPTFSPPPPSKPREAKALKKKASTRGTRSSGQTTPGEDGESPGEDVSATSGVFVPECPGLPNELWVGGIPATHASRRRVSQILYCAIPGNVGIATPAVRHVVRRGWRESARKHGGGSAGDEEKVAVRFGEKGKEAFMKSGIAGMSPTKLDDVKCLHAQLADYLLRGYDEQSVGADVRRRLEEERGVSLGGCGNCQEQCNWAEEETDDTWRYQAQKNKSRLRQRSGRRNFNKERKLIKAAEKLQEEGEGQHQSMHQS